MYQLVDEIIEELQRYQIRHAADPSLHSPYLSIAEARDRLLPKNERNTMRHVWERAVQFIAAHETRVETRQVGGNLAWSWVQK